MTSLLDAIALAAADKIAKTAGARAGIVAYRNLLAQEAEATRAAAVLRGIDCAVEAGDEQAAYSFAESWSTVRAGDWGSDVVLGAARLEARGFLRTAHLLLSRERERRNDPRVAYALGKVSGRRGMSGDALAAFESCLAFNGGTTSVAREAAAVIAAATVRVARARARDPRTNDDALGMARSVDPSLLSPGDRLQLARVLLGSKSRFERASALSMLVDVARISPALAPRAATYAARHADRMGHALTPLEADRLRAALAAHPNVKEGELAARRLESLQGGTGAAAALSEERRIMADPALQPIVVKAKAVLAGGSGPRTTTADSPLGERLTDASLAAMADLRRGTLHAGTLAQIAELASGNLRPFPRAALTLAWLALAGSDATLYPAAIAMAERALVLDTRPPRGMLPLATLLAQRGAHDVAERALRLAVLRGEETAAARLSRLLVDRAKRALHRGNRAAALAFLSEARGRHLSK